MQPRDPIVNERHVAPTTYIYYLKSRDNRQDAITRDQSPCNVLPATRATLDAAPSSSRPTNCTSRSFLKDPFIANSLSIIITPHGNLFQFSLDARRSPEGYAIIHASLQTIFHAFMTHCTYVMTTCIIYNANHFPICGSI